MKPSQPKKRPARTPEEYLDELELRTRRRVSGGLLSLQDRGSARFGKAWNVALVACSVAGVILGSRWLRRPRTTFRFGARGLSNFATFDNLRQLFTRTPRP